VPIDPKRRHEFYRAALARLKYEERIGQRVDRAEYEQALLDRSLWFCAVLKSLPGQISPHLSGKTTAQAKKIIRDYCWEVQKAAYGEKNE